MKKELLAIILIVAVIAAGACLVMGVIAIIGAPPITNGCLFRYNGNDQGDAVTVNTDKVTNTINLRADGNYTAETVLQADGSYQTILNANKYGQWFNTNLSVANAQKIVVKITGNVSLCRAYIPKNNLQSYADINSAQARIPIPRIEETSAEPVSLVFDAKTDEWRNLAEIYMNDLVVASISPNIGPVIDSNGKLIAGPSLVSQNNIFTGRTISANCAQGQKTYSPICGRYSIYSGSYVSSCTSGPCQCDCEYHCDEALVAGNCLSGNYHKANCQKCCYADVTSTMPEAYQDDGFYTSPWISDINSVPKDFNSVNCNSQDPITADANNNFINGEYQREKYFWFSADSATGLLYRYDKSENPSNPKERGDNFTLAKIDPNNQAAYNNDNKTGADYQIQAKYKVLINQVFTDQARQYLQFRYINSDGTFQNNTGGYTLNIKQTKCRRSNGVSLDDTFAARGAVQYIVVPFNNNPNDNSSSYQPINLNVDADGNSNMQISDTGYIWMRVLNEPDDYKDSFGQYLVQFYTSTTNNSFVIDILSPLFTQLKGKVRDTATSIFKNMTCYSSGLQDGSCYNLFNYIKGLLALYIMSYGLMFLLGMVEINQTDLVIKVIKISLVAGLLNDKTFNWFNSYFLDFILGFSDQIIANMSGYSLFTSGNNISNPFMFMDALMSKILFSKIFPAQMMALLSMGITGILFFVIVFVALAILLLTAFRAIAIYIMAFFAVAILIGLAPLFLTFMLFDFTRYLFDNWVRFTFRYIVEPVILMAGIIILTQLFTIYLDMTVGYSVCWKCALPIKIPFPAIPGFPTIFSNLELFCINWFSAWGLDARSGMMGINMQHVAALVIIAYCMYGYAELAGKITVRLTSVSGPSATKMGGDMSGAIEQSVQGKFGLNKQDRSNIKSQAKERESNMNKTPASRASNADLRDAGDKKGAKSNLLAKGSDK